MNIAKMLSARFWMAILVILTFSICTIWEIHVDPQAQALMMMVIGFYFGRDRSSDQPPKY